MKRPKHIGEEFKRIPKNIGSLMENDKFSSIKDDEDYIEDLVSMTKRTENGYNTGNGNVSQDYESPEEIIRDYEDFN